MTTRRPAASGSPLIWCRHDRLAGVRVCFAGRGLDREPEGAIRSLVPAGVGAAWLRQVHSSTVLDAEPGLNGPGDALVTRRPALALGVSTADCVPVLLAAGDTVAAVHAGWRGIVAGIVAATCARFEPRVAITAWIGPAIGPCCYEVGEEVAAEVCAASGEVVHPGPGGRPHLDLVAAVAAQLRAAGIDRIHRRDRCTRCHPDELWSYRRDGPSSGRNLAVVWRPIPSSSSPEELPPGPAARVDSGGPGRE